ncbi:MAG TPA: hypothetical protein VHY10_00880 [Xanthobacteraceae bacterium]|jgi:hypothetical protein|nr:hypothetical protein [Xanthobacteraceae bacterium]
MPDDPPQKPSAPIRARRWSERPTASRRRPQPYRFAIRLIGIPAAAIAGVLIYRGLREHFVLPECDSDRAKHSLTDVLKQLRMEPTRYEPITTVSSTKDEVVCNATLPLPDGGSVIADFTFYWEGGAAHMKYSVSRKRS